MTRHNEPGRLAYLEEYTRIVVAWEIRFKVLLSRMQHEPGMELMRRQYESPSKSYVKYHTSYLYIHGWPLC